MILYFEVYFQNNTIFLLSKLLQLYFLNPCFQNRAASLGEPNLFSPMVQNQICLKELCTALCSPWQYQVSVCISVACKF